MEEKSKQIANILTLQKLRENVPLEIEPSSSGSLNASGQVTGENDGNEAAVANLGSSMIDEKDYEHQIGRSDEHDAVERGVRELLQRDWFRRVWVRNFTQGSVIGHYASENDNNMAEPRVLHMLTISRSSKKCSLLETWKYNVVNRKCPGNALLIYLR